MLVYVKGMLIEASLLGNKSAVPIILVQPPLRSLGILKGNCQFCMLLIIKYFLNGYYLLCKIVSYIFQP